MLKKELLNRIKRLQFTMKINSLDAYIITAEEDIWYYTNITYKPEERPFFLIIFQNQKPTLVVPKLEELHVYKGVIECNVLTYWDYPSPTGENWFDVLHDTIGKLDRIAIEDNVKTEVFLKIAVKELIPDQLVLKQRRVKSSYELEKIRQSAKIADKAMQMIFKSIYKGASVIEPFALSRNIQTELIRTNQFDPITTSLLTAVWPAPNSSMPHSVPNLNDRLGKGPNVAMAYFRINGYAAECERTLFLEKPTKEEQELFHHMMNARKKSLHILKAGVKAADVDAAARNYLVESGFTGNLLHRTGHGVGLGNHEAPYLAEGSDEVLEENMVITIEPGIYLKGVGGYRHSDTILVKNDGYELLTKAPIELDEVLIQKANTIAKIKGKMMQKILNIDGK